MTQQLEGSSRGRLPTTAEWIGKSSGTRMRSVDEYDAEDGCRRDDEGGDGPQDGGGSEHGNSAHYDLLLIEGLIADPPDPGGFRTHLNAA